MLSSFQHFLRRELTDRLPANSPVIVISVNPGYASRTEAEPTSPRSVVCQVQPALPANTERGEVGSVQLRLAIAGIDGNNNHR